MEVKFYDYAEENPSKALKFLKKAFVLRNPNAAYELGVFYRDGKYVTASKEKALEMFYKSVLWFGNAPVILMGFTKAIDSLQGLTVDKDAIREIENGTDFSKEDLANHLAFLHFLPFVGKSKEVTSNLIAVFSDLFRNDKSYGEIKERIESGHYLMFMQNLLDLIQAITRMSDLYQNLCKRFNIVPKKLHACDFTDCYPYCSFEKLTELCEDIVTMFLSLRTTQNPLVLPYSFSISDEKFLDCCEACNDDDIQVFMLSLIEAKIAISDYYITIHHLYQAYLYGKYDKLAVQLNEIKKLIPVDTNLHFDAKTIETIIPNAMIDETEKNETDNDFDKLFQDFIDAKCTGKNAFEEKQVKVDDAVVPLNIKGVNVMYNFNEGNDAHVIGRTHFRKNEGKNLHVDIFIDNPNYNQECWGLNGWVELVSEGNVIWGKEIITEFIDSEQKNHCISFSFKNVNFTEGVYSLKIYRNEEVEKNIKIWVVDLPDLYTQCFDFSGFGIFRIEKNDQEPYPLEERNCQSCFNSKDLAGVFITTVGENILTKEYPYQFILRIYNELGAEIITETKEDSVGVKDSDEKYLQLGQPVKSYKWKKGTYKAEVEFFGEVIASAEFVIAGRDIFASYHKNSVQPKTNIAGRGIIKNVENPLAKLNAMVGLEEVKNEVKLLMAKVEIDKKRALNGLKTKPISLHAAFLGNPGTGKTTVAKLLGQIYKEIGLLSSGHVVVEERSTLCGQNWNSECDLTNKALEKAKGGILLIDEAYDLVTDHPNDPGRLIISTLLSSLSDESNRDWMLILAGYPAPMEKMLNVNEGFRSRLQKFYFKDYSKPELIQIADNWLEQNDYVMTDQARKSFEALMATAEGQKDNHFGNARYVCHLLEKQIIPAMSTRLITTGGGDSVDALKTIEYTDIPNANKEGENSKTISKLEAMVGLEDLKGKIVSHLDFVRFVNLRRDKGIATTIPPLHMIFTGNPGTGKTSVADYLGEIYKSMGLLSCGRVIKVSRADMIGAHIGDTEAKMKSILSQAQGNILFIDEAYTLFDKSNNGNDFGTRAIEVLFDVLSKESIDMIVIMAGYPKEMEELLTFNPGLRGRFPYIYHFEDYTVGDLMQIAYGVCKKNNLILSQEAKEAIEAVIKREYRVRDANFSNARFVVRLITTQIMPNMGSRITKSTKCFDEIALKTILACDVPISANEVKQINSNLFDEEVIQNALHRLDSLVGLTQVKRAIHEFVEMSREMSLRNRKFIGKYPLKWSFAGNTGTGKSTVAELLSEILKGMYLLGKGHVVEVKAEEIYAGNTHQADELLKKRMKESQQGLLFVDGDAPQFRSPSSNNYNPDYLRMCLAANTVEMPGTYAIVIAEQVSPRQQLVQSLARGGITGFDHTLVFEDYSGDELLEILKRHLLKDNLTLSAEAELIMQKYIAGLCGSRRNDYANARTMKLLARSIHKLTLISKNNSNQISAANISEFASTQLALSTKVGY